MLDKARGKLQHLPDETQQRATFLQADGTQAAQAKKAKLYDAVLCHGVLGYLKDPEPLVNALCRRTKPGGIVSIMSGNANTSAVRPALERRWADALAAFDTTEEIGVLGVPTRGDTVEHLSGLLTNQG